MKATSFAIGIIMILALHAPAFAQRTTSSEKEKERLASLEQRGTLQPATLVSLKWEPHPD